jgi:molybdopterin-guanine dinucleotide biosynthesis protein A
MGETRDPIGVVLAGGTGRRIGGGKASVLLRGTPLVAYPIAALQLVLAEIVVVAKADTELPPLSGIPIWTEPAQPRHPLTGIVHALVQGGGRSVVVCAGDLPFTEPSLVWRLATEDTGGAAALVPRAGGRLQPLLARYEPIALRPLAAALAREQPGRLTDVVAELAPRVIELDDERSFFNVNVPEDLLTAAAMLDREDGSAQGR